MPKQKAGKATRRSPTPKPVPAQRANTKQHRLIELLRRPQGATIAQLAKALKWQPHTVRGTFSGVLKKRLGLTITSKREEAGRVYRLSGLAGHAST